MNVLVDTPIWSLMLRRRSADLNPRERRVVEELKLLTFSQRAKILGTIRQEVLSGIRHTEQYEAVRQRLRHFPDVAQTMDDHEQAAAISNQLRSVGIVSSPADALICATALNRDWSVFTLDQDFQLSASRLSLRLHTQDQ